MNLKEAREIDNKPSHIVSAFEQGMADGYLECYEKMKPLVAAAGKVLKIARNDYALGHERESLDNLAAILAQWKESQK